MAAIPIAAPANLTAVPNSAAVALTWSAATGAQTYNVKRSVIAGGPYTAVATGIIGTSYTDSSPINGTEYYYVVSAVDGAGESANSVEVTAIPGAVSSLANGGFETPTVSGYQYSPPGASWTFSAQSGFNAGGISANDSGYTATNSNAPQGLQVGLVQGTGSVSQAVSGLTVGIAYTVTFFAAERSNDNNGGQTWNVNMNGTTIASYAPGQSAVNYIPYSAPFTATAGSERLAFVGTNANGGDNTVFIDSVSVNIMGNPVMTNTASFSATVGSAVSFQLSASNNPTSYAASGLPAGLSVNTTTGLISGTSSAIGTFNATVSATNSIGTGSAPLSITINPVISAPVITSGTSANGSVGSAFNYQISASNSPATYAATDLYPPGLTINTSTGLISGTPNTPGTYTCTLSASNSGGTGSAILTLTIYAVPPPPNGVTGAPGYNQTTLAWSSVPNSTSYHVKRATFSGGPYTIVGTTSNTGFVDDSVTNGMTYYYVVTATNIAGESANSAAVSITPAAQAPAVPGILTAVAINDSVTLTWSLANYATSYNVKRATAGGGPYTTLASGLTTGNYTDTAVPASAAGITYYYAVSAMNPLGESANSSPAPVTVLSNPSVPTGVGLGSVGSTQAILSWNASTSTSSYNVLRSLSSGGPYTILATQIAGTGYTDSGLTPGSNYYYVVQAVNAQGNSGNSSEVELVDGLRDMTGFTPTTDLLTLAQSGILEIDDSTGTYANAVVRSSSITVNGGQGFSVGSTSNEPANFLAVGSSGGNTNDNFGALDLSSGAFFGKLTPNTASNELVTFASLTRNPGTELIFGHSSNFGLGVGSHTLSSATANSANVVFTSAPASLLIGGTGSAGTSTIKILPFAVVNSQLATYDTNSGLRPLTSAETTTTLASGASLTTNERISSKKTINAATTVNSVYLTSGGSITGSSTLAITSGALVADQSDTVSVGTLAFGAAEALLYVGDSHTLTVNSVITGSNSLTACLEDYGGTSARLVLGGANTFTGTTTLEGNNAALEVVLTNGLALQKSTLDYNNYGASLQFGSGSSNVTAATFGGLRGMQSLALTNSSTSGGAVALTVGGDGDSTSYGGILSGTGSLIKSGAGTLTLTGANTYTGVTTINAGTLSLNGSLGTGSAVTVSSGAALGGSGTVGGSVSVASGGVLTPGNASGATGTLTISNGLTLQGGSTINFDLGAPNASDQIVMGGSYSGPSSGTVSIHFNTLAGFGVGTYNLIVGATGIDSGSFAAGSLPSGYNYALFASNGALTLQVSVPLPPSMLTAVAGDGQVVLNWTASNGASSYILSRSTVSGGPYSAIVTGISATTYADSGLTDGTTYYYVVQGVNLGGPGSKSSQASATPLSSYQQWLVANNLPLSTPSTATPDNDGVAVLLKYATGLRVGTPAVNPVTLGETGTSVTLLFNRLSPATVSYIVESSADLMAWTTVTSLASSATAWSNPSLVSETGTGSLRQVTVTQPASPPCLFLRLRVSSP